jgi:hypothetical protein
MPYLTPGIERVAMDKAAVALAMTIDTPGELNRVVCMLYCTIHPLSYADKSAFVAAIRDAAAEIYRRDIAPYEDMKARDNGDLPWPWLHYKWEGGEVNK